MLLNGMGLQFKGVCKAPNIGGIEDRATGDVLGFPESDLLSMNIDNVVDEFGSFRRTTATQMKTQ